jgi:hypothetical protein
VYLPYGANIDTVPLAPRFSAHGKVTVEGSLQTSGAGARFFNQPVVYEVESANGLNHKTYTVRVQELNTRIYVDKDASGLNNGASWEDAFVDLKAACETAALFPDDVPREIWIAEGTYRPSETGAQSAYFPLTPNTSYIGGFAGGEAAKTQRTPAAHPVIISGDLGGAVRSRHLFYRTSSLPTGDLAFEDLAFTAAKILTGGAGQEYSGAAVSVSVSGGNSGGTVRIKGCTFTDLEASCYGGAVCIYGMGLDLSESRFVSCRVPKTSTRYGGAVYVGLPNKTGATVNVEEVTFDTTSAYYGGAVYIRDGRSNNNTVNFSDISLENVSASNGGIYVDGQKNAVTMSDIRINKNTNVTTNTHSGIYIASPSGGTVKLSDMELYNAGISTQTGSGKTYLSSITVSNSPAFQNDYVYVYGSAYISDVTVDGTWTTGNGAVYLYNSSGGQGIHISRPFGKPAGLTIRNINGRGLYISNNSGQPTAISGLDISDTTSSGYGGGAQISVSGGLSIESTNINGAHATGGGGGIYIDNSSTQATTISELTIINATASSYGGGAHITVKGGLSIENTHMSGTHVIGNGYGGGIYINNFSTQPTVISGLTTFDTSITTGSSFWGGGVAISIPNGGDLSIDGMTITKAKASYAAGGLDIFVSNSESVLSVKNMVIDQADAPMHPGAYIWSEGPYSVTNAIVNGISKSANYPSGGYECDW